MHDRRPALIARCRNSADVSNAVTFARERELLVSVRGGAVAQVDDLATAFPHRNIDTMLVGLAIWGDAAEDQGAIASLKEWWGHLEPYTGGYYENLSVDTEITAVGNYGPVYGRLSEIKAEYDPMNLFRMNSNVRPMT
jgi:FAD/FMN-containing dehydrogenase